jgi:hypothetical protein
VERAREEALYGVYGVDLAAAAALCCAGKLLTGNVGSLFEQHPLKAPRAPCGLADLLYLYLSIKYYITYHHMPVYGEISALAL